MAAVPKLERRARLRGDQREAIARELLKQYNEGLSIRQLRDRTGYSIGRIRALLGEAGVEFRSRGGTTRVGRPSSVTG